MSNLDIFNKAIALVLQHEGGFVDNKADKGGPTNMGITLETFKNWLILSQSYGDISKDTLVNALKIITKETATQIYHDMYWVPSKADYIKCESLAIKYFDFCVNAGIHRSITELQNACNSLLPFIRLKCDGIIGSLTLSMINSLPSEKLLESFKDQMNNFYKQLVANNPSQKIFLKGWLNRVNSE